MNAERVGRSACKRDGHMIRMSKVCATGLMSLLAIIGTIYERPVFGQAADRIIATDNKTLASGEVVAVTPNAVDVLDKDGETKKFPIEQIREVQFGGEPQSLKSSRSMLYRGRYKDAADEVAKIEAAEMEGATDLIIQEKEFVEAASKTQAAMAAGQSPAESSKLVQSFIKNHPKSHHAYYLYELLGDVYAKLEEPAKAQVEYDKVASAPAPAFKVRAACAKARMLLRQKKYAEGIVAFEQALEIEANDDASKAQKREAQLGKAACFIGDGKSVEAVSMVKEIIKSTDPEEKELLGAAYNVLGLAYRNLNQDQEAIISFLSVDLVYNSSPVNHAEALGNLTELWEKAKMPERSRDAMQILEQSYPTSPWAKKTATPAAKS